VLKVFPNSSHTPFFEEPEAYFSTVLAFLNQHPGNAPSGRATARTTAGRRAGA
jgi:hypothetical protein